MDIIVTIKRASQSIAIAGMLGILYCGSFLNGNIVSAESNIENVSVQSLEAATPQTEVASSTAGGGGFLSGKLRGLAKSVTLNAKNIVGSAETEENLDPKEFFVETAQTFEGKIPYVWGAKLSTDEKYDPTKSGLDCSGFVQYVYYLATGDVKSSLGSTAVITSHYSEIDSETLQPGDIGVIRDDGSYYTVKGSSEKFYTLDEAKEYVEEFNDKLKEESWEEYEVEKEVTEKKRVKVKIGEDGEPIESDTDDSNSDNKEASQGESGGDTPSSGENTDNTQKEPEAPTEKPTEEKVPEENPPIENTPVDDTPVETPQTEASPAEQPLGCYTTTVNNTYYASEKKKVTDERGERTDEIVVDPDGTRYRIYIKTEKKKEKKTEKRSTLDESKLLTEKDITLHSNHVGIYVGTDEDGNQLWCHCAGKAYGNTVVIGKNPGFKHFYRIF